jgi:hypothetical protein
LRFSGIEEWKLRLAVTRFEIGEDWTIAFLINHFSILISQVMEGIVLMNLE